MADYKVQLPVFEGPMDLLLYLIRKEEVDIYEVNLTKIATQFLEYVEMMRRLDLDVAGEFLVMAATLMYIKSRELLPVEQQVQAEGEEEESLDPRWELIRQLVEYKKFKEVAGRLQNHEIRQEGTYPHLPMRQELPPGADTSKPKVSLLDLLNAVNAILKRFDERESVGEILEERWTVSEKIEHLLKLSEEQPVLKFSELFAAAANRLEVVVTFLALLELVRLKRLAVRQPNSFDEIEICRMAPVETPMTSSNSAPAAAIAPAGDAVGFPKTSP